MSRTPSSVRPADAAGLAEAAARIAAGGLVAFPTETVYGLGADATSDAALAALFAAKDRPRFNPLIVHFADAREATREAHLEAPAAKQLAAAFWPGALTLVVPRRADSRLSLLVSAGLDTVALRVPDHPVARALLGATPVPVAAPSANRSGRLSPTTAAHVVDSLGRRVGLVLDGGRCPLGVESTVVDLSGQEPALLRPGGVATDAIEAVVGPLAAPGPGAPRSPGMLERHYAPGLPLRLDAPAAEPGEALLAFGPDSPGADANLSPAGEVVEAAANLFAMLRALDRPGFSAIAVMPIPETGLGQAINDRLRRAAAPARPEAMA